MNPTTTTADFPEGIKECIRAENSPRIRVVMDYFTKRSEWQGNCFPMQTDPFGNQYLNSDGFAIEGSTSWTVRLWKHFWARVNKTEIGINPKVLFRVPDVPKQTAQNSQGFSM